MSPLPPIISSVCRCCGRIEYLMGPNTVECRPMRKRASSSRGRLSRVKPAAASSMMAISAALTMRIRRALSYLSAICPALAEKRKKGRMKIARQAFASSLGSREVKRAPWKLMRMTSAFFSTLSFSAPRNCVAKRGRKRRAFSRPNCPDTGSLLWGVGGGGASAFRVDVGGHGAEALLQEGLVDPVEDFLALFLAQQHARFT